MAKRDDIIQLLNGWLEPEKFKDYCPNGLQVEGCGDVHRIVTGVTASQAFLDQAVAAGADMVLVHHGYFWRGEDPRILGIRRRRLATLFAHELNLVAYHLPLDAHPVMGNNIQLAHVLDFSEAKPAGEAGESGLLWTGTLESPLSPEALAERIGERLNRMPLHVGGGSAEIRTLAWCTGAAQGFIEQAVGLGVDAYISGEISEPTVHSARECGIHYYAAGHHATERYGVQALGAKLQETLDIEHLFIDVPNPV